MSLKRGTDSEATPAGPPRTTTAMAVMMAMTTHCHADLMVNYWWRARVPMLATACPQRAGSERSRAPAGPARDQHGTSWSGVHSRGRARCPWADADSKSEVQSEDALPPPWKRRLIPGGFAAAARLRISRGGVKQRENWRSADPHMTFSTGVEFDRPRMAGPSQSWAFYRPYRPKNSELALMTSIDPVYIEI